ncbi:MAG: succinyl-diaminopimelate desuccinylase, partial [Gammaproteobacteria bacterium]
LKRIGFAARPMQFGEVSNLWARRGEAGPVLCFLGHTDVVPPGKLEQWHSDPFAPEVREGLLYGRGAADMKCAIAAFVTACERSVAAGNARDGAIAVLLTSDEEGPALDGTVKVLQQLRRRDEKIDYCLVGEPSSTASVGDVVKIGRRGSLSGRLTLHGVQGHVAYPANARNPIHEFAHVLSVLDREQWDHGNEHFPPTTFQVSNVRAGTGPNNVIPGQLEADFNFRFSTELTREQIESRVHAILDTHEAHYTIEWTQSGAPFLTAEGLLVDAVRTAIAEVTGMQTVLSTAGGTSDGRFVAPTGAEVVELGPVNATIHSVNERVSVRDLATLSVMYERIIARVLG